MPNQSVMKRIREILRVTYEELLYKVTWPSWEELWSSATAVLVSSFILALMIVLMDAVSKQVLHIIYQLF